MFEFLFFLLKVFENKSRLSKKDKVGFRGKEWYIEFMIGGFVDFRFEFRFFRYYDNDLFFMDVYYD